MINNKNVSILIAVFFGLIIMTDFHYKVSVRLGYETFKLTLPTKLLVGTSLAYCIIKQKLLDKKDLVCLSLFAIVILLGITIQNQWDLSEYLYIIGQYIFSIILFLFFFKNHSNLGWGIFDKTLSAILLINFFCIIIAILFDFQIFRTYQGIRFGYNGIFKSTSTASYFYMFILLYHLMKKDNSKRSRWLLFITIFSSLIVGSKTLFAFVTIVLLIHLLRDLVQKQNYFSSISFYILSTIIVLALSSYFIIPLISLNKALQQVLIDDGVVSAILSYRDEHVINALSYLIKNYDLSNYFFGGLSMVNRLTEVAIIDMFLSFGIIGTIIFLTLFFKNLPRINSTILITFFTLIFCIIMLRGNFFYFPSVIYISITIFTSIINYTQNIIEKN